MLDFQNPDYFILPPYEYQFDGLDHILNKAPNGCPAIFDEMGVGKTKQAVDAASILYQNNKLIDTVIVVCPKSVRGTWDNEDRGEIAKHCKSDYAVIRYETSIKRNFPKLEGSLLWITVSYSILRTRINDLLSKLGTGRKILLIVDESSYVKSPKAKQTEAVKALRQVCERCFILNGTPYANSILDLWSQFDILDPTSIGNIGFYHFRARYTLPGGYEGKEFLDFSEKEFEEVEEKLKHLQTKGFDTLTPKEIDQMYSLEARHEQLERIKLSLEKLKQKLKPWIIRREKRDVLTQLPPKLPPVFLEAPLSAENYRIYKEMKNEMVAWAEKDSSYSEAVNGAVKVGRLAQITSGILGGMQVLNEEGDEIKISSEWENIGEDKLQTFWEWYSQNRNLKVIVWSRWRREMFRLREMLQNYDVSVGMIIGGQSTQQRELDINAFSDGEIDVMIAHPLAGGFGIDGLQKNCYTQVYLSYSHSAIQMDQSSARIDRPGQTNPISTLFITATTPDGKNTVDHLILDSVFNKQDMAKWTMDKWKTELKKI